MTTPCDQELEETHHGVHTVLRGSTIALFVRQRTQHVSISSSEMQSLGIDVVNQTMVSVVGTDADRYDVRLCVQAGGANEDEALRSLDGILLTRTEHTFTVRSPPYSHERPAHAWLNIDAPEHRPVTVNGSYSYVEVFGIDARLRITTTHARIKLLEVGGDVKATAHVGVIDYLGDRGRIQLDATGEIGEINLRLTASRFHGALDATAERAVRVLLPPGWESPFEAVVYRPELFLCRANIRPYVHLRERHGLAVFTFGSGDPVLRLVSHGVIVIDSTDRLSLRG